MSEREPITEDEAGLAAHGWELRLAEQERGRELWFAVQPWMLPEADRLHRKGWLARQMRDQRAVWRLTDEAIDALRTDTIRSTVSPN